MTCIHAPHSRTELLAAALRAIDEPEAGPYVLGDMLIAHAFDDRNVWMLLTTGRVVGSVDGSKWREAQQRHAYTNPTPELVRAVAAALLFEGWQDYRWPLGARKYPIHYFYDFPPPPVPDEWSFTRFAYRSIAHSTDGAELTEYALVHYRLERDEGETDERLRARIARIQRRLPR